MVKKYLRYVLIIATLFLSSFFNYRECYAYDNIVFNNITIENGLPQSTIDVITQDSRGYIWIGTNDGLVKFNGYDFIVYRHDHKNDNSIVGNYILSIEEDKHGDMWIATTSGVSRINIKSGKIYNYNSKNGLVDDGIAKLIVLNDNSILVGTRRNGGFIYDRDRNIFTRLYVGGYGYYDNISSMEQGIDGSLFIGGDGGLYKINATDKTISNYMELYEELKDIEIYRIYSDKLGNIWLATRDDGAFLIDKNNNIKNYTHDRSNPKSIASNFVKDIIMDNSGNIWMCTNSGLSKLNMDNGNIINYKPDISDKHSLINSNAICAFQDKSGLIWVGTYSGISTFDSNVKIQHYKIRKNNYDAGLSGNMVTSIYEDHIGHIWIGTGQSGINIIDRTKKDVEKISYESNRITDIVGNGEDIYIATKNGLLIVDRESREVIYNLNMDDGLNSEYIRDLFFDSKGQLWIGSDNGINILDTINKKIINVADLNTEYNFDQFATGDILEDSKGNIWVGSFLNKGLLRFDRNSREFKVFKQGEDNKSISNNTVRTIYEDSEGNIWMGTSGGINKYSYKDDTFTSYTTSDGMMNDTVYGILEDDMGNMWFSTNYGLEKLDINQNKFTNYNVIDGLQNNEFNGNAYFKSGDGNLIFGGINGLNIINPMDFASENIDYNVNIDYLKVNGKNVDVKEDYVLKHSENSIAIGLFISEYKVLNKIRYNYRLSNEQPWKEISGNEIQLNNLAPGNYEFQVKAVGGMKQSNNIMNIKFKIKQPFWKSRNAIIVYLIIIVLIIYKAKIDIKKLDIQVAKRTKELQHQMIENENLYNKVIELEKRKNNYLVNISHELRTPLNVISSTRQLISSFNDQGIIINKEKMSEYMNIQEKNIQRLLKLINDLIDTEKIEHGNYRINISKNDIVYVVEEAALTLKQPCDYKGIELIIDPEIEECIIECDDHEIERCIVNLVSNAVKFTESGGTILVKTIEKDDTVEIIISDDGIGIEEEKLKGIFDRFYQCGNNSEKTRKGSGLGLAITKSIVGLHGGTINVSSKLGCGTTFTIVLPKVQEDNKL